MYPLREDERNFGTLSGQHGALPLTDLGLRVSVNGLDYRLILSQTFVNLNDDSIEAIYTFPLPARAAVTGFTLTTQSHRVEGKLKERAQARSEYHEAIEQGHQAAMAEEERPEIFTMTVGNLPAGEQVEVELTLLGPLSCMDDSAFFRFPLVVAPKYIPEQALEWLPDAARLNPPVLLPGYPNPVRLAIEVELDVPLPFQSTLPLQECDGKYVYSPQTGRVDHDFLLTFPFDPERQITSLQVHDDNFCLTLIPPARAPRQTASKQVVILLDRSGSMEGWKMTAAARTTIRLLESLNDHDAFCVLAFDTGFEEIRPESRAASDGLVRADDRNRSLYAREVSQVCNQGGTEVAPALRLALGKLSRYQGDERHLVLITDGHIGNDLEIHALLAWSGRGVRVSTIGIDQAVNAGFLQKLAHNHRGLCQLVHNETQLDQFMTRICQAIGNPSLRNIVVDGATDLVYQHTDLYPGIPTRIYGRLRHEGTVRVTASGPEGAHVLELTPRPGPGLVRKLWAREFVQKMEYLYEVGAAGAPSPEQITRFSLTQGVLCRFTAFLAIDDSRRIAPHTRTHFQPVSLPAGWSSACSGIRVDLLPTEKRGFQWHPLAALILLPFTLLFALILWMGRLALSWWRPGPPGQLPPLSSFEPGQQGERSSTVCAVSSP